MPSSFFNDYPNAAAPTPYAGSLTGAPPQPGYGPYGSVPQVPSPGTTSVDALLANINNLGNIGQLGGGLTAQGSANAMQPLNAAIPGLSGYLGQAGSNAGSLLQGQIPADVLRNIQQGAAERGVATGQGAGSPNTNAAYLRALGLTSLDLQNQGLGNLRGLMSSIPTGPQFNPQSMLLSPNDLQGWQYLANVLRAAPDPAQAAAANLGALNRGINWGNQGGYQQPWQQTAPGTSATTPNAASTAPTSTTPSWFAQSPGAAPGWNLPPSGYGDMGAYPTDLYGFDPYSEAYGGNPMDLGTAEGRTNYMYMAGGDPGGAETTPVDYSVY